VIRRFDTVYVHPGLADHPRTRSLLERAEYRRLELTAEIDDLHRRRRSDPAGTVMRGKFNLALMPYRGRMTEACPASPGMSCCRYRVINLVAGFPIDCSY
jgi:hypothetical protein